MSWTPHHEEDDHFVIHGNLGAKAPIRIAKANLSPEGMAKIRKLCKGGPVQKLSGKDGDSVVETPIDPDALSPTAQIAAAPIVDPTLNPPDKYDASAPMIGSGVTPTMGGQGAADAVKASDQFVKDDGAKRTAPDLYKAGSGASPDDDAIRGGGSGGTKADAPKPNASGQALLDAYASAKASNAAPQSQQSQQGSSFQLPPLANLEGFSGPRRDLAAAQAMEQKGIADQATVAGQKSDQIATATQEFQNALKANEADRVAKTQQAQAGIDKVFSDIAGGQIDPNHFWSDKGPAQKVGVGIGLLISGIGSGLSGQPNMAAQFIQRSIDQDIDAQKANLGRKETLLGYMYKKYGNIQDATSATRSYLMANMAGQTQLIAAKMGSKEAAAAAQILGGQWKQNAVQGQAQLIEADNQRKTAQRQQLFNRQMLELSMRQGGQQGAEPGELRSTTRPPMGSDPTNPLKNAAEIAKDRDDRTVKIAPSPLFPAGGSFRATDKDTRDKVRDIGNAGGTIMTALKEMRALADKDSLLPYSDAKTQWDRNWHSVADAYGPLNGVSGSDNMQRSLEAVLPSAFDAKARGSNVAFEPFEQSVKNKVKAAYIGGGLASDAWPVDARPR